MSDLTLDSQFLYTKDDVNGDGEINAKDKRSCTIEELATFLKPLIDTDTIVTYEFGSVVDTDPNDGVKKLVLEGSDGSTTCVLVNDSTELPDVDTDTTYTLQVIDNVLTLIGSDGSTSGGDVFIQTFDETFSSNPDGSHTFTDDDGSTVTIPRPLTADEICQAVLGSLTVNPAKLAAYKAIINEPDVTVSEFTFDAGVATITLTDGTIFTDTANGPVVGNYSPQPNGNVDIPLTDGGSITLSGLVSPDDVDFASTTVTANDDGDLVITYFNSDGDVITTSTIPGDEMLGGLSFAADGCTLTGTLDDGTLVSVPLCDLISTITRETNPDGSIVFTHVSGGLDGVRTSWTIYDVLTQSDGTIVPRDCIQPELLYRDPTDCTFKLAPKNLQIQHVEPEADSMIYASGITPVINDLSTWIAGSNTEIFRLPIPDIVNNNCRAMAVTMSFRAGADTIVLASGNYFRADWFNVGDGSPTPQFDTRQISGPGATSLGGYVPTGFKNFIVPANSSFAIPDLVLNLRSFVRNNPQAFESYVGGNAVNVYLSYNLI